MPNDCKKKASAASLRKRGGKKKCYNWEVFACEERNGLRTIPPKKDISTSPGHYLGEVSDEEGGVRSRIETKKGRDSQQRELREILREVIPPSESESIKLLPAPVPQRGCLGSKNKGGWGAMREKGNPKTETISRNCSNRGARDCPDSRRHS